MKFFFHLRRLLDEQNFPAFENLSVIFTVDSARGQAMLIDALAADAGPITVETRRAAETEKAHKVAVGSAYGIPFKIERRT